MRETINSNKKNIYQQNNIITNNNIIKLNETYNNKNQNTKINKIDTTITIGTSRQCILVALLVWTLSHFELLTFYFTRLIHI